MFTRSELGLLLPLSEDTHRATEDSGSWHHRSANVLERLGFFGERFSDDPDPHLRSVPDERDAQSSQIIQELLPTGKIPAQRDLDVGKRIANRNQAIAQNVDGQQVGIGQTPAARRGLQDKGAGLSGLTAGMTEVSLLFGSENLGTR
jgi:hypothetical protein